MPTQRAPEPFYDAPPEAPGATPTHIRWAERQLAITLPDDYRAFLLWSNGWEGTLGKAYLQLVPLHELSGANDEAFRSTYPGALAIGGDGGLETFALDYRRGQAPPRLLAIDRNNPFPDSVRRIGPSFAAGIARLRRDPDGPWDSDT